MSSVSALDLFREGRSTARITTGCSIIDRVIGGIPCQGITEISGEAGCGKTQLCLTLSLTVQLEREFGGLSGSTAFLSCGEGMFPLRRLVQMSTHFESLYGISSQKLLSQVHFEQCYNTEDTMDILKTKLPSLIKEKNIKLLIIDSLAGVVRFEFDSRNASEMKARTSYLFTLAKQLKMISDIFRVAIVVVNQVQASGFESNNSSQYSIHQTESIPALGLAWAHCVNTRIVLLRDSQNIRSLMISTGSTDEENRNSDGSENYSRMKTFSNRIEHQENGNGINTTDVYQNAFPSADDDHSSCCTSKLSASSAASSSIAFHETVIYPHRPVLQTLPTAEMGSKKSKRAMVLDFSPYQEKRHCSFMINDMGITGNLYC